jgi:hypothetical protein
VSTGQGMQFADPLHLNPMKRPYNYSWIVLVGVLPIAGHEWEAQGPWSHLWAGLQEHGDAVIDLRSNLNETRPDAMIVFNFRRDAKALMNKWNVPASKRALVLMEPRASAPSLYRKDYLGLFAHRFAASPYWARNIGGFSFAWPQNIALSHQSAERSALASMICANKRSAVQGSLYGLRRQVIEELERSSVPLALFGPGWDLPPSRNMYLALRAVAKAVDGGCMPEVHEAFSQSAFLPRSWRGIIADKDAGAATAPIAIVIENSADYVSEKLFDAIRVGRVPIYVGPRLEDFQIPSSLAVTVDATPTAVVQAVSSLSLEAIGHRVEGGREWLSSDAAQAHAEDKVLFQLGLDIALHLRSGP